MAERISARLSPASQGRKFGLTVGTAFLLLAGVAYWRGSLKTATVLGSIGAALLLGALVAPAQLLPVERAWMGLAHAISKVTTPILMGVLYFAFFTLIGWVRRATGRNSLIRTKTAGSFWVDRPATQRRGDLERQF